MFLSLLVSALAVVFHRKYIDSISVAATADKRLLFKLVWPWEQQCFDATSSMHM